MADTKVSALTAASAALLTHEFPVNEGGTSRKVTGDQVVALAASAANPAIASTASQATGFASETYLAGSRVNVLTATGRGSLKAGSVYRLKFFATKTAAGTATPIINIKYGTLGTTSDTTIASVTFAAGTAAVDTGFFEVFVNFRTVGSGTTATAIAGATLVHTAGAVGFVAVANPVVIGSVGSGFSSQVAGAGIGSTLNAGTSAAWTVAMVQAELMNLA
jgi:hypothetical protein